MVCDQSCHHKRKKAVEERNGHSLIFLPQAFFDKAQVWSLAQL